MTIFATCIMQAAVLKGHGFLQQQELSINSAERALISPVLILVCGDPLSQVSPSMFSSGAQQEATPRILVLVLSDPKDATIMQREPLLQVEKNLTDFVSWRENHIEMRKFSSRIPSFSSRAEHKSEAELGELSWEAEPPAETQLGYHSLCHSHNLKQRDRIGLSINLSNTVAGSQPGQQSSNVSFQSSIFNIQNHQAANSSLSLKWKWVE